MAISQAILASYPSGDGSVTETFTATDTWEVPVGVTSVDVQCWGGGQAGSNGVTMNANAGTGGIGGDYAKKLAITVTPLDVLTVTVGVGGVSATPVDGGASWFIDEMTVRARGGSAGGGSNVGDTIFTGGAGGLGGNGNGGGGGGGGGGTTANGTVGGNGSTGTAGIGGVGGTANGGNGADGSFTGNGGAGSVRGGAGGGGRGVTEINGGPGGRGEVRITYTP
jgi:hypothetical protein